MRHAAGRACLTVATLIGIAAPVAGQSVVGTVLDRDTDRPVRGALVALDADRFQTVTDSLGQFVIPSIPPGAYMLRVRHIAYGTRADSVVIPAGDVVRLVVPLGAEAIALDPIEVTALSDAERTQRTEGNPHHVVLTRDDIELYETKGAMSVGGMLGMHDPLAVHVRPNTNYGWTVSTCLASTRRRPTLAPRRVPRVSGQSAFNPGSCDAALILLDGMPVPEIVAPALLRDLSLGAVEQVEFVPPADARVRFGGLAEFGAVVIETRLGEEAEGGPVEAAASEELLERLRAEQPTGQRPDRWPYMVAGALVGVVAGSGFLFSQGDRYVRSCRSTECIGGAIARPFLPILGGAALGTLVGEIVFRIDVGGSSRN